MKLTASNCQKVLVSNILPFWINKMVDRQQGGFYGRMDGKDQLHADSPKGIILNSRILWAFAAAYRHLGNDVYKSMALRAFEYLLQHFVDDDFGGVYWMVRNDGSPLETKKQVYAQAFAIYALSEYNLATGSQVSLELAKSIYVLIEKHSFDPHHNGYLEAFDQKWDLLEDLRLSEKDANEAKTMNTHLHVLEAYTNLYYSWPDSGLRSQLENLIFLFLDKFIDRRNHFHLFFDQQWQLKSNIHSFGHDIEGGWLLERAAQCLKNNSLIQECQKVAIELTDAALEGLDTDGGLMYEGDKDKILDTDRHWWPQAEALVGLVNAFQISKEKKYLQLAVNNWEFVHKNLIDPQGEWHGIVKSDGSLDLREDKAGPWKAPYHNGRAMLELMDRLSDVSYKV